MRPRPTYFSSAELLGLTKSQQARPAPTDLFFDPLEEAFLFPDDVAPFPVSDFPVAAPAEPLSLLPLDDEFDPFLFSDFAFTPPSESLPTLLLADEFGPFLFDDFAFSPSSEPLLTLQLADEIKPFLFSAFVCTPSSEPLPSLPDAAQLLTSEVSSPSSEQTSSPNHKSDTETQRGSKRHREEIVEEVIEEGCAEPTPKKEKLLSMQPAISTSFFGFFAEQDAEPKMGPFMRLQMQGRKY